MNTTNLKVEKLLFSSNNLFEDFFCTKIYKAYCTGDKIIFVKIGNSLHFWIGLFLCFFPVIIPTLITVIKASQSKQAVQSGNEGLLLNSPDNFSIDITATQKPTIETGMLGQQYIKINHKKVYSHFVLDKKGINSFIDICWS